MRRRTSVLERPGTRCRASTFIGVLKSFYQAALLEAGIDEAGRGCLAGPVSAAAVILPKNFHHPLLNDSKQLSETARDVLRPIIEREAISWAVAFSEPEEIDRINILQASFMAMHRAVDALDVKPDLLLVDGNRFMPYSGIPHHCVIKGDSIYASIAAASVLAKTHRDELMCRLHAEHPHYDWARNKGYPTKDHRARIDEFGLSAYHRLSFRKGRKLTVEPQGQ